MKRKISYWDYYKFVARTNHWPEFIIGGVVGVTLAFGLPFILSDLLGVSYRAAFALQAAPSSLLLMLFIICKGKNND